MHNLRLAAQCVGARMSQLATAREGRAIQAPQVFTMKVVIS